MENIVPDFVVDITGFTDKKKKRFWPTVLNFDDANSKEPESPITSKISKA
jgi:hypothetical protein